MNAIKSSSVMVLLFSSATSRSDEVFKELRLAATNHIPVLPVRIEDIRPDGEWEYELCTSHWLDIFPPPLERYFGPLIEAVRRLDTQGRPS